MSEPEFFDDLRKAAEAAMDRLSWRMATLAAQPRTLAGRLRHTEDAELRARCAAKAAELQPSARAVVDEAGRRTRDVFLYGTSVASQGWR